MHPEESFPQEPEPLEQITPSLLPSPLSPLPVLEPSVSNDETEQEFLRIAKMGERVHRLEDRQAKKMTNRQAEETIDREAKEMTNRQVVDVSSPIRFPRGISRDELKRQIADLFGLQEEEGSRHTHMVDEKGNLVTVIPRHEGPLPRGTLHAIENQLEQKFSESN